MAGRTVEAFPWPWAVYRWLPGEADAHDQLAHSAEAALALARFIGALQRANAVGGPMTGAHNHYRGAPLARLDPAIRRALAELAGHMDVGAATAAWDAAVAAPVWSGAPVWIHGDLHAANLLVEDGRLSAGTDFGLLGVGDPATDLMAGWTVFKGHARQAFREAADADEQTWARARGWALYSSPMTLPSSTSRAANRVVVPWRL